jgi:hypothetical protein
VVIMTTQALSGLNGAFYRDDPTAPSTTFTSLALTGDTNHQWFQAALGYRYWDYSQTLTIEKQTHGTGGWNTVTPDQVMWVSGRVYFATALNSDDLVRATGKRSEEANFVKIFNLYDGQLTWDQKDIDTTSGEDAGWESRISGIRSFQFTADTYFYYNVSTAPYLDLRDMGTPLLAKLYSYATGNIAWIGYGQITGNDLVLFSLNKPQSKKITFKGDGELFPEMGV